MFFVFIAEAPLNGVVFLPLHGLSSWLQLHIMLQKVTPQGKHEMEEGLEGK